jgi:hypothetical protein
VVLFGRSPPIAPEPPATSLSAVPIASASAGPLASAVASAAPDEPDEPGAARRVAPEEEEDEPDQTGDEEPSRPAPPALESKWDAAPGPVTAARRARYEAQLAQLGRSGGPREINDKEGFDIVWPPASRPLLRRVKEAAADVVEARLAEADAIAGSEPLPPNLTPFFTRAFVGAKTPDDRENSASVSGTQVDLGGRLFGVILSFPMSGGSDDVLVLFERDGARHRRVMVVAQHEYASIQTGQLWLDYVVRPVGASYHVMSVHSSPWISSAWRGAHLRIFEPGPSAAQPRVLLDERNSARIGEKGAALAADERGFSARFLSWAQIAAPQGDSAREQLHHFVLEGGRYRRAAPFVATVRDLPDEWVKLPWSEAEAFTSEASRARLRPVHDRLAKASEHLDLRGRMLKKTQGERVRLRLLPDHDHAPIVFVVEGHGDTASIADVIEE